mmetsp:Transcript_16194/g.44786  ORF Transcript_16194/g.44786 Transcript_16194/m.44786 type:complete len:92 (-) Transcript_16194:977-1252(-)
MPSSHAMHIRMRLNHNSKPHILCSSFLNHNWDYKLQNTKQAFPLNCRTINFRSTRLRGALSIEMSLPVQGIVGLLQEYFDALALLFKYERS